MFRARSRGVSCTDWCTSAPTRAGVLRAPGGRASIFLEQHARVPGRERGNVTAIDPGADIQLQPGGDEKHADYVTARIPLAGHASPEWLRCYGKLADEQHPPLSARAEDEPDRSWIIVRVPATIPQEQLLQVLDAACDLIPKADAAEQAPPPAARAEAIVREWWAARRG
jgi:hypothetical protein